MRSIAEASERIWRASEWSGSFGKICAASQRPQKGSGGFQGGQDPSGKYEEHRRGVRKDLEGSRVVRILWENMRSIKEASERFWRVPEWSGSFGKICAASHRRQKDLEGSREVRILRENMRSIAEASERIWRAPEWSGSFGKI